MKRVAGTILALVIMALTGCSSGGDDPLQFESYTIVTGEEVTGIDFVSNSDGCAITASGKIYRTDDGGKSFRLVGDGSGRRLADIYFLDDEIGFVCGAQGTLLRTGDGGVSWSVLDVDSSWDLASLGFPKDEFGIVVGNFNSGESLGMGVIGTTSDEGVTWNFDKTDHRGLYFVDVVPTDHSWILGKESLVYTTDGGETWDKIVSRITGANALLFIDVQHGWEIGDNGLLRYSTDGGWSWQNKLKMTDEPLTCLAVPEPDRVYIAGNNFLAVSSNHGRNWVMDSVSHKFRFVDIDAVGHDVFAAGSGGQLIRLKY